MGQQPLLPQARQLNSMPYVTVGADARGSAVWLVVHRDIVVECVSGERAINVMKEMLKSRDLDKNIYM